MTSVPEISASLRAGSSVENGARSTHKGLVTMAVGDNFQLVPLDACGMPR